MVEPSMMIPQILFYVFAGMLLLSALLVITVKNPVHSVLFLILGFFNSAGLFLLLGAEFIAMLMVIVYVGAVAVLFLFVVMMLDIDFQRLKAGFVKHLPFSLLIALVLAVELSMVLSYSVDNPAMMAATSLPMDQNVTNTEAIGRVLYTDFVVPFQLSGLVLLVAMIGAITLTLRTRSGVKKQDITQQTSRRRQDAIEIVRVQSGEGV